MEAETEIKECWADLIEYVMIRFVAAAKKSPSACIKNMFGNSVRKTSSNSIASSTSSTSESELEPQSPCDNLNPARVHSDRDRLYWLYLQFEQADDPLGLIVDALTDELHVHIEKSDVMSQLLAKGIIQAHEVERFNVHMQQEAFNARDLNQRRVGAKDEVCVMITQLCKLNMRQHVMWVHDFLLAVAEVWTQTDGDGPVHAVAHYCRSE